MLREVARDTDTPLVDLSVELGPLQRGELFVDVLHLSGTGAQAVGAALAQAVRTTLSLPAATEAP